MVLSPKKKAPQSSIEEHQQSLDSPKKRPVPSKLFTPKKRKKPPQVTIPSSESKPPRPRKRKKIDVNPQDMPQVTIPKPIRKRKTTDIPQPPQHTLSSLKTLLGLSQKKKEDDSYSSLMKRLDQIGHMPLDQYAMHVAPFQRKIKGQKQLQDETKKKGQRIQHLLKTDPDALQIAQILLSLREQKAHNIPSMTEQGLYSRLGHLLEVPFPVTQKNFQYVLKKLEQKRQIQQANERIQKGLKPKAKVTKKKDTKSTTYDTDVDIPSIQQLMLQARYKKLIQSGYLAELAEIKRDVVKQLLRQTLQEQTKKIDANKDLTRVAKAAAKRDLVSFLEKRIQQEKEDFITKEAIDRLTKQHYQKMLPKVPKHHLTEKNKEQVKTKTQGVKPTTTRTFRWGIPPSDQNY